MRALPVAAAVLGVTVICASCTRTTRVNPNPTQQLNLAFQADSRHCSEATSVGDTVRAHLVRGGEVLVPPQEAGTPALFVLRALRVAQIDDSTTSPLFNLELTSMGDVPAPRKLQLERTGVEARVRTDSATGHWYICVLPTSKIYMGEGAFRR